MTDYLPRADAELIAWLTSLGKNLGTLGAGLGLSDAEVKADQKLCSDLITAIQTDEQKHRDWLAATEATRLLKLKEVPSLRSSIARIKTSPGYTPAIGQSLGILGTAPQTLIKEQVKPTLRASRQPGKVELRFTRGKLDGVNLYSRKKGELPWQLLGRASRSPFVDATPVTSTTGSEIREYRAYGVYHDEEVGQPSDILVVASPEK